MGGLMNECVSIAQSSCTMDVMWVRRLYWIEFDRPSLQAESWVSNIFFLKYQSYYVLCILHVPLC